MSDPKKVEMLSTRLVALVIDSIIVGVMTFMFAAFGGFAAGSLMGFLVGAAYQAYFLIRNQGQTPGKAVLKLRVVKEDGSPITIADAVVRYIGYYLNTFFFLIGWLIAIIDDKNQGFHDRIARTYVVWT